MADPVPSIGKLNDRALQAHDRAGEVMLHYPAHIKGQPAPEQTLRFYLQTAYREPGSSEIVAVSSPGENWLLTATAAQADPYLAPRVAAVAQAITEIFAHLATQRGGTFS